MDFPIILLALGLILPITIAIFLNEIVDGFKKIIPRSYEVLE